MKEYNPKTFGCNCRHIETSALFNKDKDEDFELSSNLYRSSLRLAILHFGYVFQHTKLKRNTLH